MYRLILIFWAAALAPTLMAQSTSRVDWASFLSGDRAGTAQAVAIDKDGGIWVAGSTTAQFDAPGPNIPNIIGPRCIGDSFSRTLRESIELN